VSPSGGGEQAAPVINIDFPGVESMRPKEGYTKDELIRVVVNDIKGDGMTRKAINSFTRHGK